MAELDAAFSALGALAEAGEAQGFPVDPLALLDLDPQDDGEVSFEDRPIPGEGDEIGLDRDEKDELARTLCEQLRNYDSAQGERIKRWDEIEDAYDLVSKGHGGEIGESEAITTEWLMSAVDQASARIEEAILGADPLIRTKPLLGEGEETAQWADDALRTERVLNNYIRREVGLDRLLPVICHRTVKLGSAVLRVGWKRKKWVSRWYEKNGEEKSKVQERGDLEFELVNNRQVVLWPPDIVNWQEAELVGHRATYSYYKWRAKAKALGLSEKEMATIELHGLDESGPGEMPHTLDSAHEPQQVTELWCDMPLPGESESTRFQVFLHEQSERLLAIYPNRHREQQHPYHPIRYKLTDKSAWGDGLGDEALTAQSIESALRTLELDNLMAGAYWVNWVRAGSSTDLHLDRLRPGEVLRGDSPDEFKPIKMGGDAPEVGGAIDKNRFYAREATGMAAVLGGQGDPTMKSGAGTGSTLALIEQASTKFNAVGRRIKYDLADIFTFCLDLMAQFITDEQLFRVASKEDASAIQLIRWAPPRARIRDIFHVEVQAPSASTSNEARKQSYLMLWTFSSQFVQMMMQAAGPVLQQQNPQGYMRWLQEWGVFLSELARRIVSYHDLPGMAELVPGLPEPTPQDQIIMQLESELQNLQGQLMAVQQQMAPSEQPMQPPMQPPMGPQGIVRG